MESLLTTCETKAKDFVDNLARLRQFLEARAPELNHTETKDFLSQLALQIPPLRLDKLELCDEPANPRESYVEIDSSVEDEHDVDGEFILRYPKVSARLMAKMDEEIHRFSFHPFLKQNFFSESGLSRAKISL